MTVKTPDGWKHDDEPLAGSWKAVREDAVNDYGEYACACIGVAPGQTECPCAIRDREEGHPWPERPAQPRPQPEPQVGFADWSRERTTEAR